MDQEVRSQCAEIVSKIEEARWADPSHSVFGAREHRYRIGPTVSEELIAKFESDHEINLPTHYAAFLKLVGNGQPNKEGSAAAGPSYGIFPLGFGINDLIPEGQSRLKDPPFLTPNMPQSERDRATEFSNQYEISDGNYVDRDRRMFGGLLPLGDQGCGCYHALVISGQHAGRVVNVDSEHCSWMFCFENNFLDWYERWLDEVISGVLLKGGPGWFGYTMGGDDQFLLKVFRKSDKKADKLAALDGFGKLISISPESISEIAEITQADDRDLRHRAIFILAEFDYSNAVLPLNELLGEDLDGQLVACQAIRWHASEHADEWVDKIGPIAAETNNLELFRFASYILGSSSLDCTRYLLPATSNQDESIRQQAIYTIGKGPKNPIAVDAILEGLTDESPKVVHTALQTHEEPFDNRFHEAYASIAGRFDTDEHHVLTNLNHRLKSLGYDTTQAFLSDFKAGRVGKSRFW